MPDDAVGSSFDPPGRRFGTVAWFPFEDPVHLLGLMQGDPGFQLGRSDGVKEEIHAIRSRRGQHHLLVQKVMASAEAGAGASA